MTPTLCDIDQRLQDRYELLVQEHAGQAHPTAAGPRCLPTPAQANPDYSCPMGDTAFRII
jgi:hypothetical protein